MWGAFAQLINSNTHTYDNSEFRVVWAYGFVADAADEIEKLATKADKY